MIRLDLPLSVRFGPGCLREAVADELGRLRPRRALVVTTARMTRRAPYAAVAEAAGAVGVELETWAEATPEPGRAELEDVAGFARETEPGVVIGLGGGSALDLAKLVALLLADPGPIDRYLGVGKVPQRGVPTLMAPTTAGSGSEVSQDAVLTDRAAGTKVAVKDPNVVPTAAVVDPDATLDCPPTLTATCGVDAFTHALEAFTARAANPFSDLFARRSLELLWRHLPRAVAAGDEPEARAGTSLGALLAGMAFTATGTAAVHACGYPLSGRYGIPHGAANALMLPPVVAFNAETSPKYAELREVLGADDLRHALADFVGRLGLTTRLRDAGVERNAMPELAAVASTDRRHLEANPRAMTIDDLERMFTEAW
jgi:alcohol dehydrogenase